MPPCLPSFVPPWVCEALAAMEGSALGPVEFETWMRAGTAVPMKSAAAAMPTTAWRLRARLAGTARRRWSSVPSVGSISSTAWCRSRRRAGSSDPSAPSVRPSVSNPPESPDSGPAASASEWTEDVDWAERVEWTEGSDWPGVPEGLDERGEAPDGRSAERPSVSETPDSSGPEFPEGP